MADGIPVLERVFTATIADGQSLSGAVDLEGYTLTAIYMPDTWAAAAITFQSDQPLAAEGSYLDVYDDAGTEKSVTTAADRFVLLDPAEFIGIRRLKVRSGTTGTPVNQSGGTDVLLIARPI